jgi:hypothetical protein
VGATGARAATGAGATAGGPGVAAMGFAAGWMGTACASAREAPQKRQNCAACSDAPRQREHRRCIAGAGLVPSATTRTGAMGGGVGVGGGGADEKRGGGSGTVRERSCVPAGPLACGAGAGDDCASRWPQVTQKRRPRWFALPQSGQGMLSGAVCTSPRGAKLTSGAGGRCSGGPEGELRADGTGGAAIGGTGTGWAMGGGGGVDGARAVAASEAGTSPVARGPSPIGGVGGATRGASL